MGMLSARMQPTHPAGSTDLVILVGWTVATMIGGLLVGLGAQWAHVPGLVGLAILFPLPQIVVLWRYVPRPLSWLPVTALGAAGGIVLATIPGFIVALNLPTWGPFRFLNPMLFSLMVGVIAGAVAGLAQASFFGYQLDRTTPWIVASAIGGVFLAWSVSAWLAGFGFGFIHDETTRYLVTTTVAGAIHGLLTGLVLSRDLQPDERRRRRP